MTLLGEPLATFVPGLLVLLLIGLGAWALHRWRQASPEARRVQARGWTFHDAQDLEGPLPGHATARFRTRCWSGLPWAQRLSLGEDGLSGWEFRVLAGSAQPLTLPLAREAWGALLRQHFGLLDDAQWQVTGNAHGLLLRVDGAPTPPDLDALLRLGDDCLQRL